MTQLVVHGVEHELWTSADTFRHGGHGPDTLLPVAVLEQALTVDLAGCGKAVANRLVVFYIATRAHARPQDSTVYAQMVETIIGRYPEDIARQAINYLIETARYLPEGVEIKAACERFMVKRRGAVCAARKQLVEHTLRRRRATYEAEVQRDRPIVEPLFRKWAADFPRTVAGKRVG